MRLPTTSTTRDVYFSFQPPMMDLPARRDRTLDRGPFPPPQLL